MASGQRQYHEAQELVSSRMCLQNVPDSAIDTVTFNRDSFSWQERGGMLPHQGTNNTPWPRWQFCGETGLSVELGVSMDLEVNRRVHQLHRRLRMQGHPGILSMNPTYCSLFIQYDPWQCSYEQLMLIIEELLGAPCDLSGPREVMQVPVCYGDEFGPDLDKVAQFHGLVPSEVIRLHTAPTYHVYMLGFTPGFPYLGGLDPKLHTPRKKTPRERVVEGSVGIAGQQTGIYPIESPGGWQVVGRTPLKLFDLNRDPAFLIASGQALRFISITRQQFESYSD